MDIIQLSASTPLPPPSVATIGFFDGVHRGHRYLIRHVCEVAAMAGLSSAVVTFARHPRLVLRTDYRPELLSTPEEKLALLSQTGISECVVLPFDAQMASLSARDFMERVLLGRLNVRRLVIGYDNRFGHDRTEGFSDYAAYGRELGIDVEQWQPLRVGGVHVSSSVVRSLLREGEVEMAARCLGYAYAIGGTVVCGHHVGAQMGFPTANLLPDEPHKLVPARGVYATELRVEGDPQPHPAMTNIGNRPTFDDGAVSIETHIIGFGGDLYGRRVSLSFVARLREERKFRSAAELANQLRHDLRAASAALAARHSSQSSHNSLPSHNSNSPKKQNQEEK